MDFEDSAFERVRIAPGALTARGFKVTGGSFVLAEPLLSGRFLARLTITAEAGEEFRLEGCVLDPETLEEYRPLNNPEYAGSFVEQVREAYRGWLAALAPDCGSRALFALPQSNRLTALIEQQLGEGVTNPFHDSPGCGVFRRADNLKWYAVLLPVKLGKLKGLNVPQDQAELLTEVLNLKLPPPQITALLKEPGFYPAYHMNHQHWVSVRLDDTLGDERVLTLVRQSRDLVAGAAAVPKTAFFAPLGVPQAWLLPARPDLFDVEAAFRRDPELWWHQHVTSIKPGDTVYIYMSAPIRAVIYGCVVLKSHEWVKQDPTREPERSMLLRLQRRYPRELMGAGRLKGLGVAGVRSLRRAPSPLHEILAQAGEQA